MTDLEGILLKDNSSTIFGALPPPQILLHNGTLSGGQLIGYSNLVNQPIVIGYRSRLVRVTFINSNAGADATFRYYKDTVSAPNLFHTFSFTNQEIFISNVTTSPIFEIGDLLQITYQDDGTNITDMVMGLLLEAVPA